MTRESYRRAAEATADRADACGDPVAYRRRWLSDLRTKALIAEEHAATREQALAAAIELMERRERAERAARLAASRLRRKQAEERREADRLARNARSRGAYRRAREQRGPRVDSRIGMHAIAIVVGDEAYAAVKLEARRRGTSVPVVLGEILTRAITLPAVAPRAEREPRWRRTGEGRRANRHTRIAITDQVWEQLHEQAIAANQTVSSSIGSIVDEWSARRSTVQ